MIGPLIYYYVATITAITSIGFYFAAGTSWSYQYTETGRFWLAAIPLLAACIFAYLGRRQARMERDERIVSIQIESPHDNDLHL